MLILRAYRRTTFKIAYCVTGLATLACTGGGILIRGWLGDKNYEMIGHIPLPLIAWYLGAALVVGAVMVIGFMTVNRNIIWKSRKHLLIYSYIAMGLLFITGDLNWKTAILVLLPFFMQDKTAQTDKMGIIGEISLLAGYVVPIALMYSFRVYYQSGYANGSFLGYLNLNRGRYTSIAYAILLLMYVLLFISPLMVFERVCRENELAEAEKTAVEV